MFDRGLFTLIFTGTWCLVGVVFLGVGLGLRRRCLRREERQRARASGTVAEVVRRVDHASDRTSVSFHPVVAFEVDGRKISLEAADGDWRKRYCEGQGVEVLYDPDDPSCFRLEGFDPLRLLGRVFLWIGLGAVAVGLIAAVVVRAIP